MIDEEPLPPFHLRLAAPEGDAGELDDLTRNLRREMEESDVERVELVPGGDLSEGAKGGLVTARGELNVTLRPAGLPNFLGLVRDWLSRQNQLSSTKPLPGLYLPHSIIAACENSSSVSSPPCSSSARLGQ